MRIDGPVAGSRFGRGMAECARSSPVTEGTWNESEIQTDSHCSGKSDSCVSGTVHNVIHIARSKVAKLKGLPGGIPVIIFDDGICCSSHASILSRR